MDKNRPPFEQIMIAKQEATAAAQAAAEALEVAPPAGSAEAEVDSPTMAQAEGQAEVQMEPQGEPAATAPTSGPIPHWTRPPPPSLHAPVTRNPSLPTFAGLVMLILTFFIVLTSISINDRKKSEAAMASLQDTFSGSQQRLDRAPDTDADEVARDFIVGLTGEVQSLVPLMGGKKPIPAENQVLWLPASLAFGGAGTGLEPGFVPVLRELLNASAKIPARFDYQVELRLCATEPGESLRRRATSLATALAGLKAPMNRFVIGTQACQPDRIGFAVALAPIAVAEPASSRPDSQAGANP